MAGEKPTKVEVEHWEFTGLLAHYSGNVSSPFLQHVIPINATSYYIYLLFGLLDLQVKKANNYPELRKYNYTLG